MDELVRIITISLPFLETVYRVTECHALGDTPLDLLLGKHGERDNLILLLENNMIGKKFSISALYSCTFWEELLEAFVLGYTSKEICRTVSKNKNNVLCVTGQVCFLIRVIKVISPSWVKFGLSLF